MEQARNRRRAPGMTPERRREMIVRTALPLVGEHGTAVTTGQIARAAGIGEATIFRVFADKDALIDACVAEALRPDQVLDEIAAIAPDEPLRVRLAEAALAMEAHLARMGLVLGALHATGRRGRRGGGEEAPPDRDGAMDRTRAAVAVLFEPERDRLRVTAEQAADLFMGLMFTRARPPAGPSAPVLSLETFVDVFLHGALTDGAPE